MSTNFFEFKKTSFRQPEITPTNNPELLHWLHKTAVLDDDGRPEVMFHGSFSSTPFFGKGTHFGIHHAAYSRLQDVLLDNLYKPVTVENGYIYPIFLNIKQPFFVSDCWGNENIGAGIGSIIADNPGLFSKTEIEFCASPLYSKGDAIDQFFKREKYVMPFETVSKAIQIEAPELIPNLNNFRKAEDAEYNKSYLFRTQLVTARLIRTLESKGFDGIGYKNYEEGGTSWVTFRADQCLLAPFRLRFGTDANRDPVALPVNLEAITKIRSPVKKADTSAFQTCYRKMSERLHLNND